MLRDSLEYPDLSMVKTLILLLCCLSLSACWQQSKQPPSGAVSAQQVEALPYPEMGGYGGERVMGNASLPNSFNPYLASDAASLNVIYQMFEGLTAYDALKHRVVPALAERWESNADKTVWTFHLRPDHKWSDGEPLSAADVVFTYRLMQNPQIPNNYRDFWSYLEEPPKVEALDAQTVRFTLAKPFAPLLFNLMAPILPRHILAESMTLETGKGPEFLRRWGIFEDPAQIVVNGPWRLKNYDAGERVVLERNPHYYLRDKQGRRLPYLERLLILDMPSVQAALLRFRRGELDTYLMQASDYELLGAEQQKKDFTIYNLGPTPSSLFLSFNMSTARRANGEPVVAQHKQRWFRDLAFRRAISHLIDKQGLINSVYQGRAVSQYSHINQHNPFFHTKLQDYEYNPELARKILADAGYHWRKDGQLLDAQDVPVSFELTTNVSSPERDASCALLRQSWKKVGIEVHYRPTHFSLLVQRMHESYDWDMMLMGMASNSLEPHFSASRWRLNGRMHIFNKGHADSWAGQATSFEPWEQHMQELYTQAAGEMDFEKRRQLYWRAQELEREQLPFIYTVSEINLVAVSNRFGNVRPSIYGGSGLHQVNWNSAWHFERPALH